MNYLPSVEKKREFNEKVNVILRNYFFLENKVKLSFFKWYGQQTIQKVLCNGGKGEVFMLQS